MPDYVIIGGGASGAVIAARLTADPDVSVTVLEAGPSDTNRYIHMPMGFTRMMAGSFAGHRLRSQRDGIDH